MSSPEQNRHTFNVNFFYGSIGMNMDRNVFYEEHDADDADNWLWPGLARVRTGGRHLYPSGCLHLHSTSAWGEQAICLRRRLLMYDKIRHWILRALMF